jgi:hypothetical protein
MEIFDIKNGPKKWHHLFVRNRQGISYEENIGNFCVEIGFEKKETKNGKQNFIKKIYGIFMHKFLLTWENTFAKFSHVKNLHHCPSRQ